MKQSMIIATIALSLMASCTSKTTSNKQPEDLKLDSIMLSEAFPETNWDSAKTIYYLVQGKAYRSQFYNTTQAIVQGALHVPSIAKNYSKSQISYLEHDDLPTMVELQRIMGDLMNNSDFWDTVGSDPLMDDLYYLALDTKYEKLYHPHTSKTELVHFMVQFEKSHQLISKAQFDRIPLDK